MLGVKNMKTLLKSIKASEEVQNRKYTIYPSEQATRIRFSPSEVVDLLKEIEELKGVAIDVEEMPDGTIAFIVGSNCYSLSI